MTRFVLAACVAAAALATPAVAGGGEYDPVEPCPHGSEFYYGYNRGVIVYLPGYPDNPARICIEM